MITLLLLLAVVAVLSGLALLMAWKGAVDGHEDHHGFNPAPAELHRVTAGTRGTPVGAQLSQAI